MINDLDETLKQLLIGKVPLDPVEVDISFDMPDREWSASVVKPTVNLYLYDIHENLELRSNEWMIERSQGIATRKKPPVRVDLSYLITVWTSDTADQHRLLGSFWPPYSAIRSCQKTCFRGHSRRRAGRCAPLLLRRTES